MWKESVPAGRGKLFHQGVDFACGDGHDDPLDGAYLLLGNLLSPGHAKVVLDSWLALSGHGGRQPDHRSRPRIEVFRVADGIVEVTVGFMLFWGQHLLIFPVCLS